VSRTNYHTWVVVKDIQDGLNIRYTACQNDTDPLLFNDGNRWRGCPRKVWLDAVKESMIRYDTRCYFNVRALESRHKSA